MQPQVSRTVLTAFALVGPLLFSCGLPFLPLGSVNRDAGPADAGPATDGGCSTATDCTGTPRFISWCSPEAGNSCINQACLSECPSGGAHRTCTVDETSHCLDCGGDRVSCPVAGSCSSGSSGAASVEVGSSCTAWPGTGASFTHVSVKRVSSTGECKYTLTNPSGGQTLGELWRLDEGYLAHIEGFGGWCTGRAAGTTISRAIINCPTCGFVLIGFQ